MSVEKREEKKRPCSDEELEVIIAYLKDEVTLKKVTVGMELKNGHNTYRWLIRRLSSAIRNGKAEIIKNNQE